LATFLLAFGALFSIVNPLSGAFIFFGATRELDPKVRALVSRWVSIYAFSIVAASLYVGAYVLIFFGVSIPVLRVAGGIIVAMSGWRMLNEPDALLEFFVETLAAVALLALLVYAFYRNSSRLADLIGPTGTSIVVRLSAFLLFCIGIQILWNGAAELLGTLPLGGAGAS